MKAARNYNIFVVVSVIVILIGVGSFIYIVDPVFHYRAPKEGKYCLFNEAWQNDGITRHFEYNALITGTSMTECFKASELDRLFGVKSIKVPYSGSTFKTTSDLISRAYRYNSNIRVVVRSLDNEKLVQDKDLEQDIFFPTFFYDDLKSNDVAYLLSKKPFLYALSFLAGVGTERNMDDYANWSDKYSYGAEAVRKTIGEIKKSDEIKQFTEEDLSMLHDNLEQNIENLAIKHPETEFYLFFPPYSIGRWYVLKETGGLHYQITADKEAVKQLLPYKNIHLFYFPANFAWTCDLANYKDFTHYGGWINSKMLEYMKMGKYELNEENYMDYLDETEHFYMEYDYGAVFG